MDVVSLLFEPTTWIVVAVAAVYSLYRYGTSMHGVFSEQGIPGPKPLPFIGTMWGAWKMNIPKHDQALMKKYGKTVAMFDGVTPDLFVTDADIIKSIFVKDFDHFVNRRDFTVNSKVVRKMVSIMRDQEWKDVRSSVTPAFTTGKIKRYSVLIKECADRLNNKFDKLAKADGKIDAKRQFSAFTMDVIARCAFGMKIDNLGEKDDEFMRRAQAVFSPPANRSPIVMLPFAIPRLMQYLGERIFFSEDFKFFTDLMENLILERSQSTQKYHDFVEVATEAIMDYTKEENGKKVPMWEREEVDEIVAAQSAIFLVAGFDTTATTLTASSFLLAKNPEVQEKLYDQIMSKMEQYGDVCHEMIADLPYVDHIVNEVLRMNPPVPRVERECREDITLNGRIKIKKGMVVTVPAYAIHYMEEYYPDPKTFNPERWDAENKANRNPYAFFPFGMGPRNCIGMRFALEEIKIALCSLVKQYRFFPIDETPENFTFEDGMFGVLQPHDTFIGIANR